MWPREQDSEVAESQGCEQLKEHFAELTDPRRGKVTHPLLTIVSIAVCAVICGADDFVAIAHFGRMKRKWLAQFLDLGHGVPSHDRFNQVLAALPERGIKRLVVACPAFVADNLETLEEIGIQGRETFLAAGGESFSLVPCLNAHPAWVEGLKNILTDQKVVANSLTSS